MTHEEYQQKAQQLLKKDTEWVWNKDKEIKSLFYEYRLFLNENPGSDLDEELCNKLFDTYTTYW